MSIRILIFCCCALVACASSTQRLPDTRYYTLEYPPPDIEAPPVEAILQVARFGAAPEYHTTKIIYRDHPFGRQEYTYHQWRAAPQILAADYLRRDLRACGLFTAIAPPNSSVPITHQIEGMIEQWLEEDMPEHWQASVELTITLVHVRAPVVPDMVLFQRTYRHSQSCATKTPAAVVEAMSQAMGRVSAQIIADVHATLAQTSTAHPAQ